MYAKVYYVNGKLCFPKIFINVRSNESKEMFVCKHKDKHCLHILNLIRFVCNVFARLHNININTNINSPKNYNKILRFCIFKHKIKSLKILLILFSLWKNPCSPSLHAQAHCKPKNSNKNKKFLTQPQFAVPTCCFEDMFNVSFVR